MLALSPHALLVSKELFLHVFMLTFLWGTGTSLEVTLFLCLFCRGMSTLPGQVWAFSALTPTFFFSWENKSSPPFLQPASRALFYGEGKCCVWILAVKKSLAGTSSWYIFVFLWRGSMRFTSSFSQKARLENSWKIKEMFREVVQLWQMNKMRQEWMGRLRTGYFLPFLHPPPHCSMFLLSKVLKQWTWQDLNFCSGSLDCKSELLSEQCSLWRLQKLGQDLFLAHGAASTPWLAATSISTHFK